MKKRFQMKKSFKTKSNLYNSIPLDEEIKRSIISCRISAIADYYGNNREEGITYYNQKHAAIWNRTYSQLSKHLTHKGFLVFPIKRNSWMLSVCVDIETKFVFVFLTKSNYDEIVADAQRGSKNHYTRIMSCINKEIISEDMYVQQRIEETKEDDEYLYKKALNIFDESIGEEAFRKLEAYCIVVFHEKNYELNKVTLEIVDSDYKDIYREDWSYLIDDAYYATDVPNIEVPREIEEVTLSVGKKSVEEES